MKKEIDLVCAARVPIFAFIQHILTVYLFGTKRVLYAADSVVLSRQLISLPFPQALKARWQGLKVKSISRFLGWKQSCIQGKLKVGISHQTGPCPRVGQKGKQGVGDRKRVPLQDHMPSNPWGGFKRFFFLI